MRKIWLIASTTYRKRVRSGMFLVLTLGLPLLMLIAGAIPILTATRSEAPATLGVVDETGELAPVDQVVIEESLLDIDQSLTFVSFSSREAAEAAFGVGEIGGYLLIPRGYFQGEAVTYYGDETPGEVVEAGLELYLQRALLGDQPRWLFDRVQDPAVYTYASQATGEEVGEGPALILRLLAPVALALAFSLIVFIGASQMGSAIIREKESRAMEMVVTSVRASELVAGKVLGMTLLSLTQFTIWTAGALTAAALAFSDQIDLQTLVIPWEPLVWGLLLIVPAYFLFAVVAAGLGIIAGDSQQAQQLAGIVGFLGLAPLWLLAPVLSDPGGPLAVALTLFPFTAPTVALIRMIFGQVPTWQLAGSLLLVLLALAAGIWFVARIFRAAMLTYGQALRPGQIWRALREA